MIIKKEVREIRKVFDSLVCDSCGSLVKSQWGWEVGYGEKITEISINESVDNYESRESWEEEKWHLCPACCVKHLLPFLKSIGCKID